MKKLFTVDDFMIAFVSALGYGLSETFSRLMGWPKPACMAATLVVGIALESIINRIVFSKAVQNKPGKRALIYIAFILIFLTVHTVTVSKMGVSMVHYLMEQFAYVVGFPILGFFVNLLIRAYRVQKIRRLYGDGSKGFVFDLKDEDIEEVNRQNQPIAGEYDTDCAVRTRTGIYVGERQGKAVAFMGIPYARPPVGERRWKAPEPLDASRSVFEAKHFGASPIQVGHRGSIVRHHRQSEDCLYLNVCVGDEASDAKKPVLVLFFNGDFSFGGAVDPLLYGDAFVGAHPDTLFVSFNYRLGIFGFIDFSGVPGGEAFPDAINLGLLDQIAALKWIRENIAAFGGDPDRITVMGFGSGATSICLLATSAQAKGLFRRAFVFNGSPELAYDAPQAARTLAEDLLKQTRTSTMDGLMRLNAEDLKAAAQSLWLNMSAPTCDGKLVPAQEYRAFQQGAASDIEFVIGIPGNERQVFRSFVGEQNYKNAIPVGMADMLSGLDGSAADAAQAYIQAQAAASTRLEAQSKLLEQWNALCIYRGALKLSQGGGKVHLMYWNEKPLIGNLGSGTVDAAAALLGNSDAALLYGNVLNADLSEILQCLLHKFICGDALQLYPNEIKGVDALDWKAFPRALIVSDGELTCDAIEDRLTEVEGLSAFIKG
jgi:para-nitrobenzyl esterase